MAFSVHHLDGSSGDFVGFAELVDELDAATEEHPDVGVVHESGWAMTVYRRGRVVFEHLEDDSIRPRHLAGVPNERVVWLLERLSVGDLAFVESHEWRDGSPR
jgi:hypothetical protein